MEVLKLIWESMLDADMRDRYWTRLNRRYFKNDRIIKIFIAIIASSTVASWSIWIELEFLWQILSATAAVIAIISPILRLESAVDKLSTIKGQWRRILNEYEILWLKRKEKRESDLIEEYARIKKKETEIEEDNFPNKKKWIIEIQDEILRARGITE